MSLKGKMDVQMQKLLDINKELHKYLSETESMLNEERAKVEEYEKELNECSSIRDKYKDEMKLNDELNIKIKKLNDQINSKSNNANEEKVEIGKKTSNNSSIEQTKNKNGKDIDQPVISDRKQYENNKELQNSKNSEDIDSLIDKYVYNKDEH